MTDKYTFTIVSAIWFVACSIIAIMWYGAGHTVADNAWKDKLKEQGLYHWTIDPESGEKSFVPITTE